MRQLSKSVMDDLTVPLEVKVGAAAIPTENATAAARESELQSLLRALLQL